MIIILIIITLIIVAFTVYLLSASKSKFHPLINKGPNSTDYSDKRVYMLTFLQEFNKMELYQ